MNELIHDHAENAIAAGSHPVSDEIEVTEVLVPVVPTPEMMQEGLRSLNRTHYMESPGGILTVSEIYENMLRVGASPQGSIPEERSFQEASAILDNLVITDNSETPPSIPTQGEQKGLGFGDYIRVEQHRYGADNEMYLYKVIKTLNSNDYDAVPVDGAAKIDNCELRQDVVPVVQCICCGVTESKVVRFRIEDVQRIPRLGNRDSGNPSNGDVRIPIPEKEATYTIFSTGEFIRHLPESGNGVVVDREDFEKWWEAEKTKPHDRPIWSSGITAGKAVWNHLMAIIDARDKFILKLKSIVDGLVDKNGGLAFTVGQLRGEWRLCINHIIRPDSPCPVCRIATLEAQIAKQRGTITTLTKQVMKQQIQEQE